MDNTVLITILSSLLDGLASAVLAGVVIWIWQRKYIEGKIQSNMFSERRRKEEDLFYENFRIAKNGLYELFMVLTNERVSETQEHIYDIVSSMQKCLNQINVSNIALRNYEAYMNNIFCKYNEFSDLWTKYSRQIKSLSETQIIEINEKMVKLKDEIFLEIKEVDKLYFNIKIKTKTK